VRGAHRTRAALLRCHRPALGRARALTKAERARIFAALTAEEAERLYFDWAYWARPSQLPPPGAWIVWLILSGRGGGKTRTGAETIIHWSDDNDRIALVGRTAADVRDIMVEGESGILRCSPPWNRPSYEPSKRKLSWPNGAVAHCYGADEPALLRGPQHKKGWVDELASFRYDEAFDNFLLGLRLGDHPQVVVTTTPKPRTQLIALMKDPTTHVTRGTTYENLQNLADAFREKVIRRYEGTRLGRQELMAEVLTDVPGALWTLDLIDATRVRDTPPLVEVVVAIDPMARAGNRDETDDGPGAETGIVVAGQGEDGHGYVLEDATVRGTPAQWATAAIAAYRRHQADRIVGEVNNGGDMVGYTLATIDPRVPFGAVWASRGQVHPRRTGVSAVRPAVVPSRRGLPRARGAADDVGPRGALAGPDGCTGVGDLGALLSDRGGTGDGRLRQPGHDLPVLKPTVGRKARSAESGSWTRCAQMPNLAALSNRGDHARTQNVRFVVAPEHRLRPRRTASLYIVIAADAEPGSRCAVLSGSPRKLLGGRILRGQWETRTRRSGPAGADRRDPLGRR
jgi:phage terminase large subunit-like protein